MPKNNAKKKYKLIPIHFKPNCNCKLNKKNKDDKWVNKNENKNLVFHIILYLNVQV